MLERLVEGLGSRVRYIYDAIRRDNILDSFSIIPDT